VVSTLWTVEDLLAAAIADLALNVAHPLVAGEDALDRRLTDVEFRSPGRPSTLSGEDDDKLASEFLPHQRNVTP
jgi:hypothetical protein